MTLMKMQSYIFGSVTTAGIAVLLLIIFLIIKKEYSMAAFTTIISIGGVVGICSASFVIWQCLTHSVLR